METPNAAPAATPPRFPKPLLWFFGVAALLVLAVVYGLVGLGQTSRRVDKVRSSLHPGMTASQVLQNATGWFMFYAAALDPARADKEVSLTGFRDGRFYLHSVEPPGESLTEAELLARIREMAGGGKWKIRLHLPRLDSRSTLLHCGLFPGGQSAGGLTGHRSGLAPSALQ